VKGEALVISSTRLVSTRHEVENEGAAQDLFDEKGWTDGLPVIAPTPERVLACLDRAALAPDHVIGIEPVRARPITAEKAAINAVLAGCRPAHFPVVAAVLEAMCHPEFLLHGATASTGGCAILTVVNGPVRLELGMKPTFNVLGGSDPAAAVIGRAVRLVLRNVLDVRPGALDRATLGHPGKSGYCIAEDEEGSDWTPLAQLRGAPAGVSAVTVLAAGAPRQIMNEWTTVPEEILETFAAEMRANMLHHSIWGGNYAIVVPKQLRDRLQEAGWNKQHVQQFVFERARVRKGEWAQAGKRALVTAANEHEEQAALGSPADLLVIAAGGPAGGFGAVIPPWYGSRSRAVTAGVGVCFDC
jgi:hypothetical protein